MDNTSSRTATLIKVPNFETFQFWLYLFCIAKGSPKNSIFLMGILQVDSANRRGSLLEVVQILTDMNLIIRRAYISSDGEWFMDGKV